MGMGVNRGKTDVKKGGKDQMAGKTKPVELVWVFSGVGGIWEVSVS